MELAGGGNHCSASSAPIRPFGENCERGITDKYLNENEESNRTETIKLLQITLVDV